MTDPNAGTDKLMQIIEFDLRPPLYAETVAISEEAEMFLARKTEKQTKYLEKVAMREDQEQIDTRVRLTNTYSAVALAPVLAYYQEIDRTDGVNTLVQGDEGVAQRLGEYFDKYLSFQSLHQYCVDAALHFSKQDPNAWTVFEHLVEDVDGQRRILDMYPVEVLSREVRGFDYNEAGVLQWLAFEFLRTEVRQVGNKLVAKELSDFYLYGKGFSVHFAQVDDMPTKLDYVAMGYDVINIRTHTYFYRTYLTSTQEVPAIRWTAYPSSEHNRKIGELSFADGIPILRDIVRDKSFFDLQKVGHIRPEKMQYVKPCTYRDEETGILCDGGWLRYPDRTERCDACHGSGKLSSTGEQDLITLRWPDDPAEIVDLASLSHYVERPVNIAEFYRDEIRYLSASLFLTIYNQQGVSAEELANVQTATQVTIEANKINNKLAACALLVCRAWQKAWRVGFQYFGVQDYTVKMTYPADLGVESLGQLINRYGAAKTNGLPYAITWGIATDILQKQYRNSPVMVNEIKAFEEFKPWRAKSPEEIALIIGRRADDDPQVVLWSEFDRIKTSIQAERQASGLGYFHEIIDPAERERIIMEKVAEVTEGIKFKGSTPALDMFVGAGEAEDAEGDEDADNEDGEV